MATHFFGITDRTFAYSFSIGRNEFGGTGFRNPVGLAVNGETIYVANRSYENRPDGVRITVCTYNEDFIGEFGSAGEGDGQFIWPSDIAVDSDGKVYVSDEYLHRITIFDKDGNYLSKWGKQGSGEGEFNGPASLAMTGDGHVVVADAKNHRIQKYTLDGQFVAQCGSYGDGPGQFNMPWGVSVDVDGNIYVADWRNDRIQKLSPEGESLAIFGSSGSGVGQFKRPSDVCVDQDGDIYIADRENNRVQILAPDGRFLTELLGDHQISKWGKEKLQSNPDMIRQRALAISHDRGEFEKRFCNPCAIWVDDQYRIMVLDHVRGRIQVYTKSDTPVLA